ncbi:hypothetical protein [Naasia aerilata]|uniref:Uncharacterized protein n=1 Tax=Naasia aerilata TaxID=1162966 RepID=A0ABM8G7F3_9MICO|nr:hypothetical protein [Naasia aerilata]BDZ44093.1 hypothetical protein GCM10025866_00020 [Naasia aerilata]BDZ47705.1 hypothetical protein GCM10025866_36140 [Naasia aerilata]
MFRAVSGAVLEGRREHPFHPVAATIEVLEIMETALAQLRPAESSGPVAP